MVDPYLCTSRDGDSWDLSWVYSGKGLFERGEIGSFDEGFIGLAPILITWKDRHWIYYNGGDNTNFGITHKTGIGLATLRLDGMVYLEPWIKDDPAWMITKPFSLEGSHLDVNADAKKGWLAVEIPNADTAEPIRGFTREDSKRLEATDGVRLQIQWKTPADLAAMRGKTVRLKFHLKNTKLYAFQLKAE